MHVKAKAVGVVRADLGHIVQVEVVRVGPGVVALLASTKDPLVLNNRSLSSSLGLEGVASSWYWESLGVPRRVGAEGSCMEGQCMNHTQQKVVEGLKEPPG